MLAEVVLDPLEENVVIFILSSLHGLELEQTETVELQVVDLHDDGLHRHPGGGLRKLPRQEGEREETGHRIKESEQSRSYLRGCATQSGLLALSWESIVRSIPIPGLPGSQEPRKRVIAGKKICRGVEPGCQGFSGLIHCELPGGRQLACLDRNDRIVSHLENKLVSTKL